MKMNPTFSHALLKLSHPLTLTALGLVVFNDLVLRPFWPSWWSGKLSDLGVIFFLPLLLAALLAPLVDRLTRRSQLSAGLAFGSVLAAFVLLKASPLSNAWLTAWLPVRAVPDPSDLLVLPAWGAALVLWLKPTLPVKIAPPRWGLRLLLLPLAALVTLADAAAPTYGIECLSIQGSTLRSHSIYSVMQSSDGGATWRGADDVNADSCIHKEAGQTFELTSPRGVRYRGSIAGAVERSTDGQNWQAVYAPVLLSQAEQTYLQKTVTSNFFYQPGPLDALVDPASGNLVLAMGLEGVLVVPEANQPFWAPIGQYQHKALTKGGLSAYVYLLAGEIWLVMDAGLLWLVTASLRLRRAIWMTILSVLGWVFIVAEGFFLEPSRANSSYTGIFTSLAVILTSLWVLGLLITTIVRQRKLVRRLLARALFVPLIVLILILPYLGWSLNLIPAYWIAQALAGAMAAVAVTLGVLSGPRQADI